MNPPKGEHYPAAADDLRSPCPVLNSLANSGYIARDGRNITAAELKSAIQYVGLGIDVASALVSRVFQVHSDDDKGPPGSSKAGLRDPGQVNKDGVPVLNLDQVGRPHALEHDVSITRQDRELGDCIHLDPDLYEHFVQAAKEDRYRSKDLGSYRKTRYEEQKQANPHLQFGKFEHYIGCAEASALRCVFGKGVTKGIPEAYVRAVFGEERLPYNEGWTPRKFKAYFPELIPVLLLISHYAWPF
ncbi:putative peroxidase [Aspergillus ellipticus CBS 707.79]|uniref:Putative peroxidase n=1 Tax=Aspergillus ellipticus CBS 707.79 TaxID=1448320 RepID=A0A319D640_9EURO|nr:putative peroxidase [Aspergillus ellipticus CBS 707.79]